MLGRGRRGAAWGWAALPWLRLARLGEPLVVSWAVCPCLGFSPTPDVRGEPPSCSS